MPRSSGWTCSVCTFDHDFPGTRCGMCGALRATTAQMKDFIAGKKNNGNNGHPRGGGSSGSSGNVKKKSDTAVANASIGNNQTFNQSMNRSNMNNRNNVNNRNEKDVSSVAVVRKTRVVHNPYAKKQNGNISNNDTKVQSNMTVARSGSNINSRPIGSIHSNNRHQQQAVSTQNSLNHGNMTNERKSQNVANWGNNNNSYRNIQQKDRPRMGTVNSQMGQYTVGKGNSNNNNHNININTNMSTNPQNDQPRMGAGAHVERGHVRQEARRRPRT